MVKNIKAVLFSIRIIFFSLLQHFFLQKHKYFYVFCKIFATSNTLIYSIKRKLVPLNEVLIENNANCANLKSCVNVVNTRNYSFIEKISKVWTKENRISEQF